MTEFTPAADQRSSRRPPIPSKSIKPAPEPEPARVIYGSFDDPSVKTIVNDTFLAGTLHNIGGSWLFWNMTAGPSSPLSYDHYYYYP